MPRPTACDAQGGGGGQRRGAASRELSALRVAGARQLGQRPASKDDSADEEVDSWKGFRLFIAGLPRECHDDELRALVHQVRFRRPIKDSDILECRVLNGRGCGYLAFRGREAAEEALDALQDRQVNGWDKILRARWMGSERSEFFEDSPARGGRSQERGRPWSRSRRGDDTSWGRNGRGDSRETSHCRLADRGDFDRMDTADDDVDRTRLFIGQLRSNIAQAKLVDLFSRFGDITQTKYLEDKGVAYIGFETTEEADRARKALDGKEVEGISRGEGLNVQFAKKRRK